MLALEHHVQGAIDRGLVRDAAGVARRPGFTRARLTKTRSSASRSSCRRSRKVFCVPETVDGVEPMSERALRTVSPPDEWADQRRRWKARPESCGHRSRPTSA